MCEKYFKTEQEKPSCHQPVHGSCDKDYSKSVASLPLDATYIEKISYIDKLPNEILQKNSYKSIAVLKCYWNEIFVSEIFAPICSFEYADHHELICFGQKQREDFFFDLSNPKFYTKSCPGPGTESNRLMMSLVVFTQIALFISLTFACVFVIEEMSDSEGLSSESSSAWSEVVTSSEEEDSGDYFELNGNFARYQGEPLADSEDADMADDDEDEDGILPSVLEQRYEGQIALNDW